MPALAANSPANRYSALKPVECHAQAQRRRLPLSAIARNVPGVKAPVRLIGPLNGIRVEVPSDKTPFGILDCRLALVLDDMTELLGQFGVTELHIDNMYRPQARISGKRTPSQHAHGLAVDILSMTLRDQKVIVETAWSGELGTDPCGPASTVSTESDQALSLRNVACEIARRGLFHHVITPNRDAAHRDHLHFDIEAGETTLLLE